MEKIKSFCIKRLLLLMQKTMYENLKFVVIGLSSIFVLFSVIIFLAVLNEERTWEYMEMFFLVGYFLAGLFISGMAFTNLRTKEKSMSYLTLPASSFEKFLSEWLLTSVGFTVLYILVFYVFNFILFAFGTDVSSPNLLDITDHRVLNGFLQFFILQSVFLAGAATFRRVPIFFTGFTVFVVGIVLSILGISLSFILKEILEGYLVGDFERTMDKNFYGNNFENLNLTKFPKYFYYYLLAPIFWAVTYYKLKEKEA